MYSGELKYATLLTFCTLVMHIAQIHKVKKQQQTNKKKKKRKKKVHLEITE